MASFRNCAFICSGLAAFSISGTATAASFLHSQILGLEGQGPLSFTLNDDDAATFIDNTGDQPDILVPEVVGGVQTGNFIAVEPIQVGDSFRGVVSFTGIDTPSSAVPTAFDGYQVTGAYMLNIVDISGPTAFVTGSVSLWEDTSTPFDFSDETTFSDGTFLGSFSFNPALSFLLSPLGLASSAAGIVDDGDFVPGAAVVLTGEFDNNGEFADTTQFSSIGAAGFNFQLQGPADGSSYDFASDGGITISAVAVPSPISASLGLFGLLGLGLRRRQR